jgi:hypothetical protein
MSSGISSSRMSQVTRWGTPAEASTTYAAWLDPAVSPALDRRRGPGRVAVQPVVARVRVGGTSGGPPVESPGARQHVDVRTLKWIAAGLGLAVGVAFVAPDWRLAVIVPALLGLVLVLHRIDSRSGFGVADGFLAFRGESSWPRGVQEDDDFRWAWSADARR